MGTSEIPVEIYLEDLEGDHTCILIQKSILVVSYCEMHPLRQESIMLCVPVQVPPQAPPIEHEGTAVPQQPGLVHQQG